VETTQDLAIHELIFYSDLYFIVCLQVLYYSAAGSTRELVPCSMGPIASHPVQLLGQSGGRY